MANCNKDKMFKANYIVHCFIISVSSFFLALSCRCSLLNIKQSVFRHEGFVTRRALLLKLDLHTTSWQNGPKSDEMKPCLMLTQSNPKAVGFPLQQATLRTHYLATEKLFFGICSIPRKQVCHNPKCLGSDSESVSKGGMGTNPKRKPYFLRTVPEKL